MNTASYTALKQLYGLDKTPVGYLIAQVTLLLETELAHDPKARSLLQKIKNGLYNPILEMEHYERTQPIYSKPGDYCAVCGCQEFWSREEEE